MLRFTAKAPCRRPLLSLSMMRRTARAPCRRAPPSSSVRRPMALRALLVDLDDTLHDKRASTTLVARRQYGWAQLATRGVGQDHWIAACQCRQYGSPTTVHRGQHFAARVSMKSPASCSRTPDPSIERMPNIRRRLLSPPLVSASHAAFPSAVLEHIAESNHVQAHREPG